MQECIQVAMQIVLECASGLTWKLPYHEVPELAFIEPYLRWPTRTHLQNDLIYQQRNRSIDYQTFVQTTM